MDRRTTLAEGPTDSEGKLAGTADEPPGHAAGSQGRLETPPRPAFDIRREGYAWGEHVWSGTSWCRRRSS